MLVLGYALAALIGLSLGLMGGGGSILTVPILVYVLGYDAKLAIAMSLPVVGVTSLVGALEHWRARNVDLRVASLFGVCAMVGAYAGARLAVLISGAVQLALLAILMLAAAIMMLRSAERAVEIDAPPVKRGRSLGLLLPIAFGVGVLTGLVGTGGGFLIVPALVLLGRVSFKQAVGTSLLVIAMNCASAYLGYHGHVQVPWLFVLGFTAVAVGGILVGTNLVRYVAQDTLKRAFAVFLLFMGAFILAKNRHAFSPRALSIHSSSALSLPELTSCVSSPCNQRALHFSPHSPS